MIPSEQLKYVDGREVLVRQTTPPFPGTPVTLRGVVRVVEAPAQAAPCLTIALSFPSVFTSPPEEQTLYLDEHEVRSLLASEREGVYEYTLRGGFDDLRTRVPVAKVMKPPV